MAARGATTVRGTGRVRPFSRVLARNINTLLAARRESERRRSGQDRLADAITRFTGSMPFVLLHALLFGGWIVWNMGWIHGLPAFDPTFVILAMAASVEAIFLSTFVLISQNRLSEDADRRAHLDLQIGLLTEHELTRALQMLDAIQDKLGIENDSDIELAQLEMETRPEDVLAEIKRVEEYVKSHPESPELPAQR